MSGVFDGPEPEERAGQDKGQKKLYVEPEVTREEVLPDITGQITIISPTADITA